MGYENDLAEPTASMLAQLIVRSATDFAIITSNTHGIITSWSPGAEKVMGWSADQAVGQRVDLFFTPEDVAARQPRAEMDDARRDGFANDERWHIKADGSRFWANGEMQPLRENGEIVGFVKILRDRTEQHEMEQKLRAAQAQASAASEQLLVQERRLREMFEQAPGFIAVFQGPELRYELVNPSYQKLVGHRDLIGKTVREALPEVEGQGYFEKLDRVFSSGEALAEHTMPVMLRQAPGAEPQLRYVDYVFQPMRDASGIVTGLFLEGFDVTDAVLARQVAEKLAVEQAAILGQLGEGVIATDADGRISFVNAAAERLHGVARLDVEPDAYSDTYHLLTEDGAPYPFAELPLARAVMRGEIVHDARWRIRRPDGSEVVAIGSAQPMVADGKQVGAVLTVRDDSARAAAEDALRRSEAELTETGRRLDAVLNNTKMAIFLMDDRQHCVFANAAAETLTGYSFAELSAHPLHDVIHNKYPDGRHYPLCECPIDRAFPDRDQVSGEELFVAPNGSFYPVAFTASPVLDETGKPIGTVIEARNIAAEKAAEAALRQTEERYRLAARATNDAVWDWDLVADRILWNEALHAAFGYAPAGGETSGGWWIEHIHPDDQARVDARIHAVIDGTQDSWSDEYRFVRADGSVAHIFDRGTVIRDTDGRAVRMIGAMLDLTERETAEAALRSSETRYRTLFEAIDAGFCIIELVFDHAGGAVDYRFLEINPTFEAQSGLSDAVGRSIRELAPDTDQRWVDLYAGVAASQAATRHEDFFPGLDRWFEVYAYPVDAPELRRVAVLFNDITARKCAEEELREQTRTLETLNRTGAALAGDLDLERLVQRVTDAGVELTGASMGAFFYNVLGGDGQSMMLYTLSGVSREDFDVFGMPRPTAIFQPTFVGEGVIRSDDILEDRRYGLSAPHHGMPEGHPPVRSYLAVSVTSRSGEVVGGLFFGHPQPCRFTDRHEQLIVGIAAQAAIAIDNARLFDEAQRELGERRRAEEALTELNRTLEARVAETVVERDMIWRTSQDLFLVCGFDGLYRSLNPAWLDALGYDPGELIGARFDALVHPDEVSATQDEFARLVAGDIVSGLDLRLRHKDGRYRWFSWTCVPQGDVFYASGRDVTARKELEDQLRQSQKMEAVGQLTGGIAHDFNNLLTIVSGNIDMAKRSLGADGDARALRSLGNAAKGADRAAALTQRLLAFSRRQPLQPRATDVNKLITGMTELLDRALGETVDLQVVAGAGLWRVEVDPNQLENAVLNLAVNARDAMAGDTKAGGGKLTVETTNAHIDEAYAASQREVAPGQYVLISVTDTGEGMPADVVAKAFDPFFSTKDVGKGTGLGLSQVYGYVKQSGGHVKIYSEDGEGTTVKIYLPRLIADMNAADEEDAVAEAPAQGQESILVVEDDDDVRIYTVDSLRELGYRVLEAHDGASALRLLERQDEPPRLLLTDVVMPGMSGRELAEQARILYPDMQVLYTTGYARNAIVHGGRLDPGVELLPKPFTFEALAAKIREVIEKAVVERALIVDPADDTRDAHAALLVELGFAAEQAGTVREALGKLRAAGGRFDFVVLSHVVPVGNLDAVLAELHAIRKNLPILIVGSRATAPTSTDPCVGQLAGPVTMVTLREALHHLRVRCSRS